MKTMLENAKKAKAQVAVLTTEEKNAALMAMADALLENQDTILAANALDMEAAKGIISDTMLDRLLLTPARIEGMAAGIRQGGIPATVSNSAGAFVCNDVMYTLLHRYAGTAVKAGFIHVPYIPEQGSPNLALERIVMALECAIAAMETD